MSRFVLLLLLLEATVPAQSVGTARLLEQAGLLDRALSAYRLALEARPEDPAAYDGFRRLSIALNGFDSLLQVTEVLAAGDSTRFDLALGRADAMFGLGRDGEALASVHRAAARWPERIPDLADELVRWEQYGDAAALLTGLRARPGDTRMYADRLVEIYLRQRRHADAVREIVGLVNTDRTLLAGYLHVLAEVAVAGRLAPVLGELDRIGDGWARARARAEVYLAAGRESDAVREAEQSMNEHELNRLAQECEAAGALKASLALYQRLGFVSDAARVLRKSGRVDEALELLSSRQSPGDQFELAELYRLQKHDCRTAAEVYEAVLRLEPGNDRARYGLAAARLGLGQLDAARDALTSRREVDDESQLLLTRIDFLRQLFDSAKVEAMELARRFPNSLLVDDALGLALLAQTVGPAAAFAEAMLAHEVGDWRGAEAKCRTLIAERGAAEEQARFLLARVLRVQGRGREALDVLDSLRLSSPEGHAALKARFEQADILRRDLRDENGYRASLEDLILCAPGSVYAAVARGLLEEANDPAEPGGIR